MKYIKQSFITRIVFYFTLLIVTSQIAIFSSGYTKKEEHIPSVLSDESENATKTSSESIKNERGATPPPVSSTIKSGGTPTVKVNTPTPTPNNTSNTNQDTTPQQTTSQISQSLKENSPTITITEPLPTKIVVINPGSGNSITSETGGYEYIYVTPTPNLGAFEASFSYTDGLGTIRSNKPIKACEGVQKSPDGTLVMGPIKGYTRWGCPDGNCSYICELYFAPPNTPRYDWPYGAQVISEQDEVKTFASW